MIEKYLPSATFHMSPACVFYSQHLIICFPVYVCTTCSHSIMRFLQPACHNLISSIRMYMSAFHHAFCTTSMSQSTLRTFMSAFCNGFYDPHSATTVLPLFLSDNPHYEIGFYNPDTYFNSLQYNSQFVGLIFKNGHGQI